MEKIHLNFKKAKFKWFLFISTYSKLIPTNQQLSLFPKECFAVKFSLNMQTFKKKIKIQKYGVRKKRNLEWIITDSAFYLTLFVKEQTKTKTKEKKRKRTKTNSNKVKAKTKHKTHRNKTKTRTKRNKQRKKNLVKDCKTRWDCDQYWWV